MQLSSSVRIFIKGQSVTKPQGNVDRLLNRLRQMAADFDFKPDERINESHLAEKLSASRTPIREALNRLVAEGFLTFQPGRGFFCRSLSPKRILDLYEARTAIECQGVYLAVERANDDQIRAAVDYLNGTEPEYDSCKDPVRLLSMDEDFHMHMIRLSANDELVRMLDNVNGRVRYVRLVNLSSLLAGNNLTVGNNAKLAVHRTILNAVAARNRDAAVDAMRGHIARRREEATEAARIAYSQLYVPVD